MLLACVDRYPFRSDPSADEPFCSDTARSAPATPAAAG